MMKTAVATSFILPSVVALPHPPVLAQGVPQSTQVLAPVISSARAALSPGGCCYPRLCVCPRACLQTRQELEAKTGEAASLSRQLHGSMEEAKQLEAANTKLQNKV